MTLLAVVLAGCGGRRVSPVQGVVTLDGEPVAGATVSFLPDGEGGRPATGFTAADGTFRLTTYQTDDGALAGDYRVLVQKGEAAKDETEAEQSALERAKAKYEEKAVQRKRKPSLPSRYAGFKTTPLRCTVPVTGTVELELHRGGKS